MKDLNPWRCKCDWGAVPTVEKFFNNQWRVCCLHCPEQFVANTKQAAIEGWNKKMRSRKKHENTIGN